jgi:hypothetical protein
MNERRTATAGNNVAIRLGFFRALVMLWVWPSRIHNGFWFNSFEFRVLNFNCGTQCLSKYRDGRELSANRIFGFDARQNNVTKSVVANRTLLDASSNCCAAHGSQPGRVERLDLLLSHRHEDH